ncbi:MAG TPA: sugar transferase [Gaiellaceae bacterium]|nr:sugar transferase [Gaiellaceae bacterium]
MNATEHAALVDSIEAYDEMTQAVGERTLEILDRRRRTAVVHRRGWLVRRMLLAADLVGLLAAFLLVEWFARHRGSLGAVDMRSEILVFVGSLPLWVVVAKLYGLYDRDEARTDHSTADDVVGVFHMVTVCTWLLWAAAYLTHLVHPTASRLVPFWAFAIAFISLARAGARAAARRHVAYLQNTVIVGAGDVGQLIAKKLMQHPEYGINLVGFVDAAPKERRDDLEYVALLGDTSRLPAIVRLFDVERVIFAFSNETHEETLSLMRALKDFDVQVDIVPRLFELVGPDIGIHTVEGIPMLGLPPVRLSHSSKLLKRTTDVVLALVALVVFAPLMLLIALAIRLDSPGPVFFRQVRMGARNEVFRIVKFRSMTADADARKGEVAHLNKHLAAGGDPRMFKIDGDPRVTRVGRWLRRVSLDELPQLYNVVRGEMSLVGPRPLILDEDRHVRDWARRRLTLKPGITGPWQVLGRDDIPFSEMTRLDYLYVTNWSLWNDLKLITRTLPLIVRSPDRV